MPVYHKIKQITSFNRISSALKQKIILEMFIPSVLSPSSILLKSRQEMDLAPDSTMNFLRYKFFLYFSGLIKRGPDLPDPSMKEGEVGE